VLFDFELKACLFDSQMRISRQVEAARRSTRTDSLIVLGKYSASKAANISRKASRSSSSRTMVWARITWRKLMHVQYGRTDWGASWVEIVMIGG
jgi:hypothetical protein